MNKFHETNYNSISYLNRPNNKFLSSKNYMDTVRTMVFLLILFGLASQAGCIIKENKWIGYPPKLNKLVVFRPASHPHALHASTTTKVLFTVQTSGFAPKNHLRMTLRQITEGKRKSPLKRPLHDNGRNGDITANDGIFSANIRINTKNLTAQDCLHFQASADSKRTSVKSPVYKLCLTDFPINIQQPNIIKVENIIRPKGSAPFIADEVMVAFASGITEAQMAQIAKSVGGRIVGTILSLGVYQIQLSKPLQSKQELDVLLAKLKSLPEVVKARHHGLISGGFGPSDIPVGTNNAYDWLSMIHAPQAWTAARGNGQTIAVVDSGLQFTHQEFQGYGVDESGICVVEFGINCPVSNGIAGPKLIRGPDLVDQDYQPDDVHGHGTWVTGIAASVAPESSICAIRVLGPTFNANQAVNGEFIGVEGLLLAQHCASIINASFGSEEADPNDLIPTHYCPAIDQLRNNGKVIVAAAMNNNSTTTHYPAACQGVIAVGATDSTGANRLSTSNHGNWVHLAAPGEWVYTTRLGNGYGSPLPPYQHGTSYAAPMVAGAAAVVWSGCPHLHSERLEDRLMHHIADPLPGEDLGSGRLNLGLGIYCIRLVLLGTEQYEVRGREFIRFRLSVENREDFPNNLFENAPMLPPCGLNDNAARTWVNIYNGQNDSYIYGFCALNSLESLARIWFAVPVGETPPSRVYIDMFDRQNNIRYLSNEIDIP